MNKNSIVFSDVINLIFHGAHEKGIKYCILRNYEDLPESTQGGDIDMLILPQDKDNWCSHLYFVANNYGLKIGVIQKHYHGVRYCLYDTGRAFFIKLDVHYGEFWKGIEYISSSSMLKSTITYKKFYIPSAVNEALLSLLDPMLTGGKPKSKYSESIRKTVLMYRFDFASALSSIVGKNNADNVTDYISDDNYIDLIKLVPYVKKSLWLRHFYSSYGRDLLYVYRYLKYELNRRLYPLGFLIEISGSESNIKQFIREFKNITTEQFPGIDINKDYAVSQYVDSASEVKVFKRIMQSYNIVISNNESLNKRFRINKKISVLSNERITDSGNEYNYVEMVYHIYDDVLAVYASSYDEFAN